MKTRNKKGIYFFTRTSSSFYCATYDSRMQPMIDNWKKVTNTVKVINGKVFIHFNSYSFFTELMRRNNIGYTETTSL